MAKAKKKKHSLRTLSKQIRAALTKVNKTCENGLDDYAAVRTRKGCKASIKAWWKLHKKADKTIGGKKKRSR